MKIRTMILAVAAMALGVAETRAYAVNTTDKVMEKMTRRYVTETPVYMKRATVERWRDGWFVGVQGGAGAFIGTPLGCDDLFGRTLPAVNVSLGRWHTPRVANRLVYQGWQWKSGALERQTYHHYHADLMVNVMPAGRFDIVPLVGVGLIHNATAHVQPFAINYGVQGRWRVLDRLHVTAELSNATAFANADGIGSPNRFGDNLLSLSAGVTWNLGESARFRRVVNARPYMVQNTRLHAHVHDLAKENELLKRESVHALAIAAELRKILELEGLLSNVSDTLTGIGNDYSGLRSLRKRLANGSRKRESKGKENGLETVLDIDIVGAPIYFFFEFDTDALVAEQQLVNVEAIARVAQEHGLHIAVTGAADSATGTPDINADLALRRAEYIADRLQEHGIASDDITLRALGGIADYTPDEANRQCIVTLHWPQNSD